MASDIDICVVAVRRLQLVSDFNGEDRFMSRIGVGGLINLQKMHQAHVVLSDIQLLHDHADKCQYRAPGAAPPHKTGESVDRYHPKISAFNKYLSSFDIVVADLLSSFSRENSLEAERHNRGFR